MNRNPPFLRGGLHLFRSLERFLDRAFHIEGLFRDVVVLALGDALKAFHCVRDLDVSPRRAGELLSHMEGLRKEFLYLTSPRHRNFLVFAQFVDTKDRDDVLQIFVSLQRAFHQLGDVVMFLPHNARIKNA